jgi:hypothetical protein
VAVIMGQVAVPGNATVAAFTVPPGLANFLVYQPATPQAVYIGTSSAVSTLNGMPVPVTPAVQENYHGSRGATYYATTGNATASTFHYLISTAGA